MGFLANSDGEEDETSESNWISTEDGEEDKEEISLFNSFSEKEMMTNLAHLLLQTISFPKPKRGKKHLFQIMLVEQLRMSFDSLGQRSATCGSGAACGSFASHLRLFCCSLK